MNARPAGSIRAFWLPVTEMSTPHSSILKGMAPMEEMPSTTSSAGVWATTLAMACTSETVAVEVSHCVM